MAQTTSLVNRKCFISKARRPEKAILRGPLKKALMKGGGELFGLREVSSKRMSEMGCTLS